MPGKQTPPPSPLSLLFILAVGVVATSSASILVRFAQAADMGSLAIAAWRLVFASAVLLPYGMARHGRALVAGGRKEWALLGAAGVFLGLHFGSWIASLACTSVASSVVLVSLGPVFVAAGSWPLLGERPSRRTCLGIALAAGGSVVIGWGDFGHSWRHLAGDLLALAGAAFVAGYLMIGRRLRPGRALVAYVAPVYGAATATLLAAALLAGQPLLGYRPEAYGWALALALAPQLVGHTTLNWALRHLSATFVSLVTLTEPVAAALLAYLILGEPVAAQTALGGAAVLAGLYIASTGELDGRSRSPTRPGRRE